MQSAPRVTVLGLCGLIGASGCDPDAERSGGASLATADAAGAANVADAGNAKGASPTSDACGGEERRQFDFWIGRWTVIDPAGDTMGTNGIRVVANGCGLLESWRGRAGNHGTSLNLYDPRTERWEQHWTGGGGMVLHLTGGMRDGSMVLGGTRAQPGGPGLLDRVTWTPIDGGRVRQLWEVSADGGTNWRTVFDGTYVPLTAADAAPAGGVAHERADGAGH